MANITDPIPADILSDINFLTIELDKTIPIKDEGHLLIATWNIRAFGNLTLKWVSSASDSPKRDLQSLLSIIQIIKRFDIIAVQEVKGNIKCLRETMKYLGDDWSFLMTDVTKGNAGNSERLAYIFNNKKVKLSGLACEIVIPKERLGAIGEDALDRQFARTPYAVGFKVKDKTFVLLTLHVLYGSDTNDRIPELKAIADWMYQWAKQLMKWKQGILILGDFNIERKGDKAYDAFVNKNLFIPTEISTLPSTIFNEIKHYDQIGWFKNSKSKSQISLDYITGGIFDFRAKVLPRRNISLSKLSFRISDHFPLWVQFKV